MHPNQQLWEKGDFTRIADTMRESGEEIVAGLSITPGMRVLDVGCGDGTTALPAARRGADVLGVDIATNLVDAGNKRAADAGLINCRFLAGDAADLSAANDDAFDLTVSIFGAMFAWRPDDVARELVRVTRPGGQIVMGNWIPGDPTLVAQILTITGRYTSAPPAGFVSPMTWGDETTVRERFVDAGIPAEQVGFRRETFTFRAPTTPVQLLATFRDYYGPTMNAYAAAAQAGRADELDQELRELFTSCNTCIDPGATTIPATYLRVTVAV